MSKIKGLTPLEVCNLRLRCAEIATLAVSRAEVEKATAISFAARVWEFMLEALPEEKEDITPKKGR